MSGHFGVVLPSFGGCFRTVPRLKNTSPKLQNPSLFLSRGGVVVIAEDVFLLSQGVVWGRRLGSWRVCLEVIFGGFSKTFEEFRRRGGPVEGSVEGPVEAPWSHGPQEPIFNRVL